MSAKFMIRSINYEIAQGRMDVLHDASVLYPGGTWEIELLTSSACSSSLLITLGREEK